MAGSLTQIRQALADRLATIPGMNAFPRVQATPILPSAHVVLTGIEYHFTGGDIGTSTDGRRYHFTIQVFLAAGLSDATQLQLDEFIDSNAIPGALQTPDDDGGYLDGLVEDVTVRELSDYSRVTLPGNVECFSADWEIDVLT